MKPRSLTTTGTLMCWFVLVFTICQADREENETAVDGYNSSTTESTNQENEVNHIGIQLGNNRSHGNSSVKEHETNESEHGNEKTDGEHENKEKGGGQGEETRSGGHKGESEAGSHGEESEGGGHGGESEGKGHGGESEGGGHGGGHGSRLECNCECREVEEEEHHEGHAIIWPSVIGMMVFISLTGYLFYHFYTRHQMKNILANEEDHITFFKEAIVSSTVTGIAAPGMLGFHKSRKKSKRKSTTSK